MSTRQKEFTLSCMYVRGWVNEHEYTFVFERFHMFMCVCVLCGWVRECVDSINMCGWVHMCFKIHILHANGYWWIPMSWLHVSIYVLGIINMHMCRCWCLPGGVCGLIYACRFSSSNRYFTLPNTTHPPTWLRITLFETQGYRDVNETSIHKSCIIKFSIKSICYKIV